MTEYRTAARGWYHTQHRKLCGVVVGAIRMAEEYLHSKGIQESVLDLCTTRPHCFTNEIVNYLSALVGHRAPEDVVAESAPELLCGPPSPLGDGQ